MSYIKKSWTIEHDWRCTYCKKVNKGRDDVCYNCGKDIDEDNCEIIPADMSYENRVKDEDVARKLSEGDPDWICAYCGHRERAEKLDCTQCGAGKGEKKKSVSAGQDTTNGSMVIDPKNDEVKNEVPAPVAAPTPTSIFDEVPIPSATTSTTGSPYRQNSYVEPEVEMPSRKLPIGPALGVIGGLSGLAGFIWLMFWLFAMHSTVARVQETHWDYNVSLFERTIASGRDWRGSMHSHSFNVSCHQEIRDYHRCDPYDCNYHQESYSCNPVRSCTPYESCRDVCRSSGRRGSSCSTVCTTRQNCSTSYSTCYRTVHDTCWHRCPDYDDMCDYQYPAWPQVNQANLHGTDHTPVRPSLRANSNMACPSDPETLYYSGVTQCTTEQVTYGVTFNAGEQGQHSVQPASLQEYDRYHTGENWNAEYNHAGQFHILGRRN